MKAGENVLYIPMFKGRAVEQQVIKSNNQCFSAQMIPLVEIMKDHFRQTEFATDPITGEYIKKTVGKRQQRYRVEPTEEDRDTLEYYKELFRGKKVFIDFFRFTTDVYGTRINANALDLSIRLTRNEALYYERLCELEEFENLIPVLSIKKNFFPRSFSATDFIEKLQKGNAQIAVRLDDDAYEEFAAVLADALRENDYIMFDIGEQHPIAKEIEIEEFNNLPTLATKIVLNSPRKRNVKNGEYENGKYTELIDNSARNVKHLYKNVAGYGDYCGMKDNLPGNQIITRGCALALFYGYSSNKFKAYVNTDSEAGVSGFLALIPQILADAKELDPDDTCGAIRYIKELSTRGKSGNFCTWNGLIITRCIEQVHRNI